MDNLENDSASDLDNEAMTEMLFESVYAVVDSLVDTEKAFMQTTFKKLADSKEVRNKLIEIIPCIYAGALLSLSGREINNETLTAVVSSVGITINTEGASMVSKAWGKSHLLYIYAYYFIVAFGRKNVTKEDMLEVVRSLGTDTDEETAKEALAFIKARERAKEMLESRV